LCGIIVVLALLAASSGGAFAEGELLWAKRAGGTGADRAYSVATLADGSALVTGCFWGTATFAPGEAEETQLISVGGTDIFIAKYNLNGKLIWAKRAGGPHDDYGSDIAVLPDGSALVTGFFAATATFGPGEPNETSLTAELEALEYEMFLAKYDQDGMLVWAKKVPGSMPWLQGMGRGMTALPDGTAVVTGGFTGEVTFGPGEPNETTLTADNWYVSYYYDDVFIARYRSDGTLMWVRQATGRMDDEGFDVAGLPDGSTLVTGYFMVTATFAPGEPQETALTAAGDYDGFVAKYSPDGVLQWVRQIRGRDACHFQFSYPRLTTLDDGSLFATGSFNRELTFGFGEQNETTLTAPKDGVFLARYEPDGTLAWAKGAVVGSGVGADAGSAYGGDLSALSDGSTLVTGYFYWLATFGSGQPNETTLCAEGYRDVLVARYDPDGTLKWVKGAGGSQDDWGAGIANLEDGGAVVVGAFEDEATFGAGEPNQTTLSSTPAYMPDIFIARFAGTRGADLDGDGLPDIVETNTGVYVSETDTGTEPTNPDTDGDGLKDGDEVRDLDPVTPDVQNPFDPLDPDSTGDSFQDTPDGTPDGWNDYDGDGMINRDEFTFGYDPLDPNSWAEVPVVTAFGAAALALLFLVTRRRTVARRVR